MANVSGTYQDITANPEVMGWLQQFAAANAQGNPGAAPAPPQGDAAAPVSQPFYQSNLPQVGIADILRSLFGGGQQQQQPAAMTAPMQPMGAQDLAQYAIDQQAKRQAPPQ